MVFLKGFRVLVKSTDFRSRSIVLDSKTSLDAILFQGDAIMPLAPVDIEHIRADKAYVKSVDCYGCMGLLKLVNDLFLVVITECTSVGKILDTEIFRVRAVEFIPVARPSNNASSTSAGGAPPGGMGAASLPASGASGSGAPGAPGAPGQGSSAAALAAEAAAMAELLQEQITEIKKLCNSGSFYFSMGYDLSLSAQRQSAGEPSDDRFVWNRHLQQPFELHDIGLSPWCISVIRGFMEFRTVYAGAEQVFVGVLSRISCERAGKRFLTRGVDDDGHVANFVETEQLLLKGDKILSHVQTRGSVPVFWEQPGVQVAAHKVKLSRSFEASAPAFRRHIERQLSLYGKMWLVNLLGAKEGEKSLTDAYESHVKALAASSSIECPIVSFDFHAHCFDGNAIRLAPLVDSVRDALLGYGFFEATATSRGGSVQFANVVSTQSGVIRTNCLDCLDRTNVVQSTFGIRILQLQLRNIGLESLWARFDDACRALWIRNGDAISLCYTGTGALKSDIAKTGKRTAMGKMKDLQTSVSRAIQNNFWDLSRQDAIDLFLGNRTDRSLLESGNGGSGMPTDPTQRRLLELMKSRESEYTTRHNARVFIGTWNVNGGKRVGEEQLHPWLIVPPGQMPPDVYAVGFQEIVDLTAGNIMAADDTHRNAWEKAIKDTINTSVEPDGTPVTYALVVSQQLVGVCLCIFARTEVLTHIRDVVIGKHKTGFGGYAGNKGAVAIRFRYFSTSICFVCAHLAAGQSNVVERNSDYANIMGKMSFGKGRNITNHDVVYWFGDFNYRIDLSGEDVKKFIKDGDLLSLYEADQLRVQRDAGAVFDGFIEAPIGFVPTYKFDLYSDVYDTSEKARAPAWCDRVLWKSGDADILAYSSAELKSSDHRPVFAIFDTTVREVDEVVRKRLRTELLKTLGVTDVVLAVWPIHESFGSEDVAAIFAPYGNIIATQISGDTAFISFSDPDAAQRALSLDRQQIGGQQVRVAFKSSHVRGGDAHSSRHSGAAATSNRSSGSQLSSGSSRSSVSSGGGLRDSRDSSLIMFDDDMELGYDGQSFSITDLNAEHSASRSDWLDDDEDGEASSAASLSALSLSTASAASAAIIRPQSIHSDLPIFEAGKSASAQPPARPTSVAIPPRPTPSATPTIPPRPATNAPPARPAPPKRPPAPSSNPASSSTSNNTSPVSLSNAPPVFASASSHAHPAASQPQGRASAPTIPSRPAAAPARPSNPAPATASLIDLDVFSAPVAAFPPPASASSSLPRPTTAAANSNNLDLLLSMNDEFPQPVNPLSQPVIPPAATSAAPAPANAWDSLGLDDFSRQKF